MKLRYPYLHLTSLVSFILLLFASCSPKAGLIFKEKKGFVKVEAEGFFKQEKNEVRKWYIVAENDQSQVSPDPDGNHAASASENRYLEILPDTRTTHDDPLVKGVSFSNKAGELAILSYQVNFKTTGKYYVWVRAYSTGTEDNGIHVGIDGTWPESGQRMQWCKGKNTWTWESKQRTAEVHCGVDKQIYLMVEEAGLHTIQFSMREDGFEFDAFALSTSYEKPE